MRPKGMGMGFNDYEEHKLLRPNEAAQLAAKSDGAVDVKEQVRGPAQACGILKLSSLQLKAHAKVRVVSCKAPGRRSLDRHLARCTDRPLTSSTHMCIVLKYTMWLCQQKCETVKRKHWDLLGS